MYSSVIDLQAFDQRVGQVKELYGQIWRVWWRSLTWPWTSWTCDDAAKAGWSRSGLAGDVRGRLKELPALEIGLPYPWPTKPGARAYPSIIKDRHRIWNYRLNKIQKLIPVEKKKRTASSREPSGVSTAMGDKSDKGYGGGLADPDCSCSDIVMNS